MDGLTDSEKKRAERKRQRELKDARQQELSRAESTAERRNIKEKYSESGAESGDERRRQSAIRQMERNDEVYGAGSMLGEYQNESVLDSFYDSDVQPSVPESSSNDVMYSSGDGADDASSASSGGGGGIPDGYGEISATLCIDGSPVTGTILFKSF